MNSKINYMKTNAQIILKKFSISFLLLLICRCCFAGSADEPKAIGDWSVSTNGLRARLLFAEDAPFNGTRIGVVYLELKNVSDVGNPMKIYFNPEKSLQFELCDPNGAPSKYTAPVGFDGFILSAFWLTLPHDSTLRFRVNLDGYGIPKDAGLAIGAPGNFWVIPDSNTNDFYLSGNLNVSHAQTETIQGDWQGTLKLPPVKISAKSLSKK